MSKKIHLATITILVKDRHVNVTNVNQLLTQHGHIILARLGVPIDKRCLKGCTGLITVAVEGTFKEIKDLTKALDKLYGIVAKSCIVTE